MAEFTNEGEFIRSFPMPKDAPYGYDVAVHPGLNRMVTSSFTFYNNYKKPLAEMDPKNFGDKLIFWDFKERKIISQISAGRKNRLWLEVDGAEEAVQFCQEEPEELWVGRREHVMLLAHQR